MICKKTVGRVVMISGAVLTGLFTDITYATNRFIDNKFENNDKKSSQQWDLNNLPDLHDGSITDWLNDEKAYKPFNSACAPDQPEKQMKAQQMFNSSYGFIPTLDPSQKHINFNVIREKGELTAKPDGKISLMVKGYNSSLVYEFNVLNILTAENLKLIDELQQQMNLFIQRNNNTRTKSRVLKTRKTNLWLNLSKIMLKENASELSRDLCARISTTITDYNTAQNDPYTTVLCTWFLKHSHNNVKYPVITADSPILKCLNVDLELLMKELHAFAQHELRITVQPQHKQPQMISSQDPQGFFQPILPRKKLPHQPHSNQQNSSMAFQPQQAQEIFCQAPQSFFQLAQPQQNLSQQPHFAQQKPKQTIQPEMQNDKPRVLLVQGPNDFFRPTPEALWAYQQRCALLSQQQYFQQIQQVQRENQTKQEDPRVLYVQGPNDFFGLTQQINPQVQVINHIQQVMTQPVQGMEQNQPQMSGMNFLNHS